MQTSTNKKGVLAITYTDYIQNFLETYTNNDWKEHSYTLGVHNLICRIINYIPELMTNADFTIRMQDIIETLQDLVLPDVYNEYNSYVTNMLMRDFKENYERVYCDILSKERLETLLNSQKLMTPEDFYHTLFSNPEYHEMIMRNHIFSTIAEMIINTCSIYSKHYPILYEITSNPKLFFLVERLDNSGCLITYHIDPSVQ